MLYGLGALVLLGLFVYISYSDFSGKPVETVSPTDGPMTVESTGDMTREEDTVPQVKIKDAGGMAEDDIPLPNLIRRVTPASGTPASVAENSLREVARLKTLLKEKPESIGDWQVLGIYLKAVGDYRGAEEVWVFVTRKWPSDVVAYNNLGELYKENLKDYPKAEVFYKTAVAKRVDYIQGYVSLSDLYRHFMKEKSAEAPRILMQGLASNPESIELMVRLAKYYGDSGLDTAKAKGYYEQAIAAAEKAGESAFASRIRQEMESLK